MYKHLFLEADSGTGKSTLLRNLLEPYKNQLGGFSSQRLQNEKDITIAFRIVPASDFRLAVPYEDTPESIFRMIPENGQSFNSLEVFEKEGIQILKNAENAKLILLDEIGGVELKNEAFRERLYEILAGDVPCIGVIKQHKKAASMSAKSPSTVEYNTQLREKMTTEYGCQIIAFERNNHIVEHIITEFLQNVLK